VIVRQIRVGRLAVFAYVVGCEQTRQAILIDPAAEVKKIMAQVERDGLAVGLIVNTHPHPDHTAGNLAAAEACGAPIAVHRDAEPMLGKGLGAMMAMMTGGADSPAPDRLLEDGETIQVGELGLEVLHTPGHSPGGICLHGSGAVFTGDVLFVGAVGRTDLEGGSATALKASIRERLLTLPDETIVYPGHDYGPSPTSTIGKERRTNSFV
jgi:glyoxylase-like metal-dependent hydrolase (beta-lactamase superfamily II)